jgi:hypothetical protein
MQVAMELSGQVLKIRGQQLALDHAGESWASRTVEALRIFCENLKLSGNDTFAFEEFRVTMDHDAPLTFKAWGSIPGIAVKHGIIRSTGTYRKARSAKTHAHPVLVWKIL